MTRANRLSAMGLGNGVYHLTQRCHNRAFLLKFACDRDTYRAILREHLRPYKLSLLDYCVTCNHVHLLVDAPDRWTLGDFMREVAGEFARAYNRRKGRHHAFWGDNYHATLVEEGTYLWHCLCYIELNMVRCGVVRHPCEWPWVGYSEILGIRQRYRLVDFERLCWRLRVDRLEEVRKHLEADLAERITRGEVHREECWTESLAVGSLGFVKAAQPLILSRPKTEIAEQANLALWTLQEAGVPYGQKTGLKKASEA